MSTIREKRVAVAAVLNAIPDLYGYAYWPDDITTPAAIVRPASYRVVGFMGQITTRLEIELVMNVSDLQDAQQTLDEYLDEEGDKSVRVALEADHTFGGVCENSDVVGWRDYGGHRAEAVTYIGAIIEVDLYE